MDKFEKMDKNGQTKNNLKPAMYKGFQKILSNFLSICPGFQHKGIKEI